MVDPIVPLMAWIAAGADVAALVGTRIFGDELDADESASMPRKAVVLKSTGMGAAVELGSIADISSYRIDAWAYGETPFEASRLRAAVAERMKELQRVVIADAFIHSAIREAGPISIRDPNTYWPAKVESFRVLIADQALS